MQSKSTLRVLSVWLMAGYLLLLGLRPLAAEEALTAPQKVIQLTANQLQISLQKPEYKSNFKKATGLVDQIINPHVDFDRVSVLVLGKNWRTIPGPLRSMPTGKFATYRWTRRPAKRK